MQKLPGTQINLNYLVVILAFGIFVLCACSNSDSNKEITIKIPTETLTITSTLIPTSTNTPTSTDTNTPTSTNTPTETPTLTQTPTPTPTPLGGGSGMIVFKFWDKLFAVYPDGPTGSNELVNVSSPEGYTFINFAVSPDKDFVAYSKFDLHSSPQRHFGLWIRNINTKKITNIIRADVQVSLVAWTPKGNQIVYAVEGEQNTSTLWIVEAKSGGKSKKIVDQVVNEESCHHISALYWSLSDDNVYFTCFSYGPRQKKIYSLDPENFSVSSIDVLPPSIFELGRNSRYGFQDIYDYYSPSGEWILASSKITYPGFVGHEFSIQDKDRSVEIEIPLDYYESAKTESGVIISHAWDPNSSHLAAIYMSGLRQRDHKRMKSQILILNSRGELLNTLNELTKGWPSALAWSPDGSHVVYTAPQGDKTGIFIIRIDGTNKRLLATVDEFARVGALQWLP